MVKNMGKIIACVFSKLYARFVLAFFTLFLAGCGQSGPLYLPSSQANTLPIRVASPAQTPDQSFSQPDNEIRTETQNQSQPNPQPPTKPMAAT